MKKHLLTILRDKKTSLKEFRKATYKLSHIIAAQTCLKIRQRSIPIQTPLTKAEGFEISQGVVIVPILRSGMALLPAFMFYFENARIGFLGMKRDEKTIKPNLYYENLPSINPDDLVILLDPMIATGGSTLLAIKKLIEQGATPSNILFIAIVAAPEGIRMIEAKHKEIKYHVESIDEKLNSDYFIVPGIGDFGDRFFGTL